MPIFRVKSIKIYTGQKKFTRDKYQVWVNCARDLSDQPISVYACVCDPYFSFGRTHRRQTDILTKVFHEVLAEQNNFIGDGGSTALSKTPDNNIADIADMAHMAHMAHSEPQSIWQYYLIFDCGSLCGSFCGSIPLMWLIWITLSHRLSDPK